MNKNPKPAVSADKLIEDIEGFGDIPMSEAAALEDILKWSLIRPSWQRDALRRLIINGPLNVSDFDELFSICIDPDKEFEPLSASHINPKSLPGQAVSLKGVINPIGINALAANQTLGFSEKGINIVYGDNGSGKSGYVRILKSACRTRDENIKILSNVNTADEAQQTAVINFVKGTKEEKLNWSPGADKIPELSAVSIFDSKSANTHVEKTNDVAYTPFPMQIIEQLANACDEVKRRIELKITVLDQQSPQSIKLPTLSLTSPAGSFLHELSAKSNLETLDLHTEMSEDENQRLTTLNADLAQDPNKVVARLSSLKARFNTETSRLLALVEYSSEASFNRVHKLLKHFDHTAQVSQTASENLFSKSPLPKIGGPIWKSLWEAARKYSDTIAYQDKVFPNSDPDDQLCVLCQQPLGSEAIEKWDTFEEFVKGTAKLDEEKARLEFDGEITRLRDSFPEMSLIRNLINVTNDELDNPALAQEIRKCAFVAAWRLRALLKGKKSPAEPAPFPKELIGKQLTNLTQRIEQLGADQSSDEHKKLLTEQLALQDRTKLHEIKADVIAEIDRAIKIAALKSASKTAAKVSITNKNKELSDQLVTDALRGRFAREVQKLNIGTMPIELIKVKDSNAISYFRVAFISQPKEPLGDILSEGEHRCVALAAFLAELVTSREYSGIVFDDPMSSLDHLYRRNVARRLVEEAAHRQVIIFTHDLGFLFELKKEAEAQDLSINYQTVRRRNDEPGHIAGDLPMKAKNAAPLAHAIQTELKSAKKEFDDWPDPRRIIFVKGVIEQLREAWDQAIADFIAPVLGRFDSQIKGSTLYKLSILNEIDVSIVTAARSRLSEDLHASPETLNPEDVTQDELKTETKILIEWLAEINKRQSTAKKPKASLA